MKRSFGSSFCSLDWQALPVKGTLGMMRMDKRAARAFSSTPKKGMESTVVSINSTTRPRIAPMRCLRGMVLPIKYFLREYSTYTDRKQASLVVLV